MLPDEGRVDVHGGVAPLIEITGGFVDDLTRARQRLPHGGPARHDRRPRSTTRFDEIIDFAEIGDFVDTPYKHLSSGMKVRIAFSVISRLEEPIILVDEVLAVGDKAFREKCYRAHRGAARRRPHAVLRLAQREGPAPLLHARALPRQGRAGARRPDRRRPRPVQRRLQQSLTRANGRDSHPAPAQRRERNAGWPHVRGSEHEQRPLRSAPRSRRDPSDQVQPSRDRGLGSPQHRPRPGRAAARRAGAHPLHPSPEPECHARAADPHARAPLPRRRHHRRRGRRRDAPSSPASARA